jgi:hypothetical protein
MTEEAGRSLLAKLRTFAASLDDDERRLFAALIGPGVAQAIGSADVQLFTAEGAEYDRLVRGLADFEGRDQDPAGGPSTGAD